MIKSDYYSVQNTTLRTWFEQMNRTLSESIKKEWIADMERLRTNIPFFLWFPTFASKHGLQHVYQLPSLNVQTSLLKVWNFQNGSSVSSVHPPADDLKLLLKGDTILVTPFQKGREGNEYVKLDDLKKVHQQVNYTNTILQTIAEQLNQVSAQIAENKRHQLPKTNSQNKDDISPPFFKTDSVPKPKLEAYHQ